MSPILTRPMARTSRSTRPTTTKRPATWPIAGSTRCGQRASATPKTVGTERNYNLRLPRIAVAGAVAIAAVAASPIFLGWSVPAGYQAGQRAICQAFADDVIRGQIAPEVAFDPAAPCGRAGFSLGCGPAVLGPSARVIFRKRPCPGVNQDAGGGRQ